MAEGEPKPRGPRERILDAATAVLTEKGIGAATTKEIARAAGYSEAMLYKYFDDKSRLFVAVLEERLPSFRAVIEDDETNVRRALERLVETLMRFYVASFPISVSIFSSPDLLAAQRRMASANGTGPAAPQRSVRAYLERQRTAGRLPADLDADAVATLLTGAALHAAFLTVFDGRDAVVRPRATARALVAAVLPADVA
ncbi:TetR/AcrR family transcriptional regulator [Planctomonas sp. JC2975]|uniref:TetR/AcrR family transcriptional regulator n=1 Tax=Planctomonas sp. JC2975 TaxID=2729626 RepID=UPI0014766624|nr:TetR/AcrR family transcriptional regulator [Planctomonas sp. JC2975]NNC13469.1 TetR/AcrR family transcriptional regulator [Planctomonas sp. JC2975]